MAISSDQVPTISVVLIQRGKWWIAQCLEYDIGAQANTVQDVLYELQRTLIEHIAICVHHERRPFADLPAAPQTYWTKFQGTQVKVEMDKVPFRGVGPMMVPVSEIRLAS